MRGAVLALALTLAPLAAAHAANLDAPARPGGPTIRAEIKRGVDAARVCRRQSDPAADLVAFTQCIDTAHDLNRQALGVGLEAYDAGLYARERTNLQILASAPGGNPLAAANLKLADTHYTAARDKLGLTDAEVTAAGM